MIKNREICISRMTKPFWIWAGIPSIFCVIVIWYQFGFSLGGWLEEWDFLLAIAQNPSFWNSFPGNPMSGTFAARPLQITPFFIARAIDPQSFLGFHLVLMTTCFLRVAAGSWIGYFLFRNRMYASALGMLCLVFPADTQQMSFRTLNISLAVSLTLCATALSIRGIVAATATKRTVTMIAAVLLYVVSAMVYEPVIALYTLLPTILFARYGLWGPIIRRRCGVLTLWCVAPVFSLAYLCYAFVIFKSAYGVNVANSGLLASLAHNAHYLIKSGAHRILYDSWSDMIFVLLHGIADYRFIALIAVVLLAMLVMWERTTQPLGIKRACRCVIAGAFASAAAYMPYMVSEAHMVITQRTFIGAAPGASVILVSLVSIACNGKRLSAAILSSALVFLGLLSQIYQFDQYTRMYTGVIRPYLALVADQTDPTKKVNLVMDSSGYGGHIGGLFFAKIHSGPPVRRQQPDARYDLCMNEKMTPYKQFSNCDLSNGVWTVKTSTGHVSRYPEDQVQTIRIGRDFDTSYKSTASTWHDLGSYSADQSLFFPVQQTTDHYSCVADSGWGYTGYCRGAGWMDGILKLTYFNYQAFFLAIAERASLIFNMAPQARRYKMRIESLDPISHNILSHLELAVNGHEVDYEVLLDRFIEVSIPKQYLVDGQNEVTLDGTLPAGSDLGLSVRRVDIAPSGSSLIPPILPAKVYPTLNLGQWYELKGLPSVMFTGFSTPETDGTWTDKRTAEINFVTMDSRAHALLLNVVPFLSNTHRHLEVDIEVNDKYVLTTTFDLPTSWQDVSIPLGFPHDGKYTVAFIIRDPAQPGLDTRDLGLLMKRLRLQ